MTTTSIEAIVSKVKLSCIDSNPLRDVASYPFNENKLAALERSIDDVGLWEGVIVRQDGPRYQTAFGHHRIEAAKRALGKDASVPVIVRHLTDEQMLQFMGRENLEDYNADFLVMLNAWDAATKHLGRGRAENLEPLDVARVLGWTRSNDSNGRMNETAQACDNAARLIEAKHLKKSDLRDLSVSAVRELCQHTLSRMKAVEDIGKKTNRPVREVEKAKERVGKAAKDVARRVRDGGVAQKDIRGAVDVTAYRHAKEAKRVSPLFSRFADRLAESIAAMLHSDAASEKLAEIKKALGDIVTDEGIKSVERIGLELHHLGTRAEIWERTFAKSDPQPKAEPASEPAPVRVRRFQAQPLPTIELAHEV